MVNTVVLIKPNKEFEQRDERRKLDERKKENIKLHDLTIKIFIFEEAR